MSAFDQTSLAIDGYTDCERETLKTYESHAAATTFGENHRLKTHYSTNSAQLLQIFTREKKK